MIGSGELGMAATKLRPPALPTRLVERTRLDETLDDAVARAVPLVLASAPAGSGKSTMLAAWASRQPQPAAWLQVEDGDSDPARFWSSLVAAIARHRPSLGDALAPLVVGSAGDDRVIVPALVNALDTGKDTGKDTGEDGRRLVVVVDDYHLIDSPAVHRGMERLIDLCPPQLTIIVSTRVDPPFRLGRMRVRNRLSEVRAHDLRFAASEATVLLGAVGDTLTSTAIDDLCSRTEGWAAGLVLAGLSLERAPEPEQFVRAFRGDDQLVVSYLGDELLATMEPDDRRRMLETSVLDRFDGPLVDAVTASSGGAQWLIDTAARNQLIVRLDQTGRWFRYHHLLRDLLALEAQRTFPERLGELHGRAADWFEAAGDLDQAVTHRLAGGDVPGAMRLMPLGRFRPARPGSGAHAPRPARTDRRPRRRTTPCAHCCGDGASTSAASTPRRSTGSTRRWRSRPQASTSYWPRRCASTWPSVAATWVPRWRWRGWSPHSATYRSDRPSWRPQWARRTPGRGSRPRPATRWRWR